MRVLVLTCEFSCSEVPIASEAQSHQMQIQKHTPIIRDQGASVEQVDDPEEARRIVAKGGKLIEGGSRIVSPTGRHTLNMSRALGGAPMQTSINRSPPCRCEHPVSMVFALDHRGFVGVECNAGGRPTCCCEGCQRAGRFS